MEVEPHFFFNQQKPAPYLDICIVFIYNNLVGPNLLESGLHPLIFWWSYLIVLLKRSFQTTNRSFIYPGLPFQFYEV